MENKKIKVAITHGDTNGIGYELIFKTFAEPAMLELCTPIVYGSPKVATYHRNALGLQTSFNIISRVEDAREGKLNVLTTFEEEVKVDLGQNAPEAGKAALKALDHALNDFDKNAYDVLVTLPMNPASTKDLPKDFTGQIEHITRHAGQQEQAVPIFLNENMRVGLATFRQPISIVAANISKELVVNEVTTVFTALKRDFLVSSPRIAVLALNPKGARGEWVGKEEEESIRPAIIELTKKGIQAYGPYTSEEIFGERLYQSFDAVLSMYDDQVLAPFYTLDLGEGVCYIAGLPVVCTFAAHNTPHEKAGKGVADETSFRKAIYTAIDIVRNRAFYDEPMGNPLPKLYHEKRDESEKVRFNVPKKHDTPKKQPE